MQVTEALNAGPDVVGNPQTAAHDNATEEVKASPTSINLRNAHGGTGIIYVPSSVPPPSSASKSPTNKSGQASVRASPTAKQQEDPASTPHPASGLEPRLSPEESDPSKLPALPDSPSGLLPAAVRLTPRSRERQRQRAFFALAQEPDDQQAEGTASASETAHPPPATSPLRQLSGQGPASPGSLPLQAQRAATPPSAPDPAAGSPASALGTLLSDRQAQEDAAVEDLVAQLGEVKALQLQLQSMLVAAESGEGSAEDLRPLQQQLEAFPGTPGEQSHGPSTSQLQSDGAEQQQQLRARDLPPSLPVARADSVRPLVPAGSSSLPDAVSPERRLEIQLERMQQRMGQVGQEVGLEELDRQLEEVRHMQKLLRDMAAAEASPDKPDDDGRQSSGYTSFGPASCASSDAAAADGSTHPPELSGAAAADGPSPSMALVSPAPRPAAATWRCLPDALSPPTAAVQSAAETNVAPVSERNQSLPRLQISPEQVSFTASCMSMQPLQPLKLVMKLISCQHCCSLAVFARRRNTECQLAESPWSPCPQNSFSTTMVVALMLAAHIPTTSSSAGRCSCGSSAADGYSGSPGADRYLPLVHER